MPDYGIGSWPGRRARIDPDVVALRQADRGVTYRELADGIERLARGLRDRGVARGDRVAYLGPNDLATFDVLFATLRLGSIFVPLNSRLTAPEIGRLLDDCQPSALFYGPEVAHALESLGPATGRIATVAGIDALPEIVQDGAPLRTDVGLADDAVILYTSGTTGVAKGAVLTHGNLTFNTMNQLAHVDVLHTDTAMCLAPLFHAVGLSQVSLPTLFKGGTVSVVPKFDPADVLARLAGEHVASFSAVPTMLQMLCDDPGFAGTDLSALRYLIYGGSAIAERVALAWQGRGVTTIQGYGMTEASPGVCMATPAGYADKPLSMGVPHFFTDVTTDVHDGDLTPGSTGELMVRGLNVFRGYWQRPDATEAAFVDGWYSSGDMVSIDEAGWGYVVDRMRDLIISGGENIYPSEVEVAINALDGVLESALVAVPDDRWGEVGEAYVVTSQPDLWTAETLRAALAGTVAAFKIPKYVSFVPELPKTATGKIRKQDLRASTNH
jgi:fatty-acyl-CoA synthase